MKIYSNLRFIIEFLAFGFASYLLFSLIITLIGGYSYREILCSPNQTFGALFLYWWCPGIFRMQDMENHNNEIKAHEILARKDKYAMQA